MSRLNWDLARQRDKRAREEYADMKHDKRVDGFLRWSDKNKRKRRKKRRRKNAPNP